MELLYDSIFLSNFDLLTLLPDDPSGDLAPAAVKRKFAVGNNDDDEEDNDND